MINFWGVPSLKLTASLDLKIGGPNTILSFLGLLRPIFRGELFVLVSVGAGHKGVNNLRELLDSGAPVWLHISPYISITYIKIQLTWTYNICFNLGCPEILAFVPQTWQICGRSRYKSDIQLRNNSVEELETSIGIGISLKRSGTPYSWFEMERYSWWKKSCNYHINWLAGKFPSTTGRIPWGFLSLKKTSTEFLILPWRWPLRSFKQRCHGFFRRAVFGWCLWRGFPKQTPFLGCWNIQMNLPKKSGDWQSVYYKDLVFFWGFWPGFYLLKLSIVGWLIKDTSWDWQSV